MNSLRQLLQDDRVHAIAARVAVLDGQSSHFETNAEGHVVVSCLTLNTETPIWANLGPLVGGGGKQFGVWWVPDPGTEVLISFDNGDFEGEAYLVACHGGNAAPPSGLASGVILVLGSNVQIRQPNGTANKIPTMNDLTELVSALAGAGVGSATDVPTAMSTYSSSYPVGTTVLEAE